MYVVFPATHTVDDAWHSSRRRETRPPAGDASSFWWLRFFTADHFAALSSLPITKPATRSSVIDRTIFRHWRAGLMLFLLLEASLPAPVAVPYTLYMTTGVVAASEQRDTMIDQEGFLGNNEQASKRGQSWLALASANEVDQQPTILHTRKSIRLAILFQTTLPTLTKGLYHHSFGRSNITTLSDGTLFRAEQYHRSFGRTALSGG
jgi:hypothetical protein